VGGREAEGIFNFCRRETREKFAFSAFFLCATSSSLLLVVVALEQHGTREKPLAVGWRQKIVPERVQLESLFYDFSLRLSVFAWQGAGTSFLDV
jgi:hypothetical protein